MIRVFQWMVCTGDECCCVTETLKAQWTTSHICVLNPKPFKNKNYITGKKKSVTLLLLGRLLQLLIIKSPCKHNLRKVNPDPYQIFMSHECAEIIWL
jgi:hypothetical protein